MTNLTAQTRYVGLCSSSHRAVRVHHESSHVIDFSHINCCRGTNLMPNGGILSNKRNNSSFPSLQLLHSSTENQPGLTDANKSPPTGAVRCHLSALDCVNALRHINKNQGCMNNATTNMTSRTTLTPPSSSCLKPPPTNGCNILPPVAIADSINDQSKTGAGVSSGLRCVWLCFGQENKDGSGPLLERHQAASFI